MGLLDVMTGTVLHWNRTKEKALGQLVPRLKALGPDVFNLDHEGAGLAEEFRYYLISFYVSCQMVMSNWFFHDRGEHQAHYRKLIQSLDPDKLNRICAAYHFFYLAVCSRRGGVDFDLSVHMIAGAMFVYDQPESYARYWLDSAWDGGGEGLSEAFMMKLGQEIGRVLELGGYGPYFIEGMSMGALFVPIAKTSEDIRGQVEWRRAIRKDILAA